MGPILLLGGRLAAWLEGALGIMLTVLGLHVPYRSVRDRVHFHLHRHDAGTARLHAHYYAGESRGSRGFRHRHEHREGLPVRTLPVGMMHRHRGPRLGGPYRFAMAMLP